ncbi:MAG: 4'-phosphopantetheinyl transferase superfamily protein [Brumimicrobium sp.]|nr:4'-phosphopantetheinyl transferase superfamily protein [Brumimicrobium sp.]
MVKIEVNPTSLIYYWEDMSYPDKLVNAKKQEVERKEIIEKMKEIFPLAEIKHQTGLAPTVSHTNYSHISISHSQGLYAIYLSNENIGIDIQRYKGELSKGRNYFINEREECFLSDEQALYLIWSAKEAFYKKMGGEIPDLKNNVTILSIQTPIKQIVLEHDNKLYKLSYLESKQFVLMWTLN